MRYGPDYRKRGFHGISVRWQHSPIPALPARLPRDVSGNGVGRDRGPLSRQLALHPAVDQRMRRRGIARGAAASLRWHSPPEVAFDSQPVKRSPLKRRSPLKAKTPLKRGAGIKRKSKPRRAKAEQEHFNRIGQMDCIACGARPVHVHHLRHIRSCGRCGAPHTRPCRQAWPALRRQRSLAWAHR